MNRLTRRLLAALLLCCGLGTAAVLGGAGISELRERGAGDRVYAALSARTQEKTKRPSALDFDALRADMPDLVGWLAIDGTSIDYPIVQGSDNAFYLSHLPDGSANACGSVMMDARNRGDFSDRLTVLHGHHMRGGRMFGDLEKYADEEYRRAHSVIRVYAPQGDFAAEVVAAWHTSAETFSDPLSAKIPDSDGTQRYILLSTCSYVFEDARFVVLARRVPDEKL